MLKHYLETSSLNMDLLRANTVRTLNIWGRHCCVCNHIQDTLRNHIFFKERNIIIFLNIVMFEHLLCFALYVCNQLQNALRNQI